MIGRHRRDQHCKPLVIELTDQERMPGICQRAATGELTSADHTTLERLRDALNGISPPPWWGDEPS